VATKPSKRSPPEQGSSVPDRGSWVSVG